MADSGSEKVVEVKPSGESEAPDSLPQEWTQKARDGDAECQRKLGQHYLTLADSAVGSDANSKLAIHWLSQASKQADESATAELKKCLETGTGITDENRDDVKWCVVTSSLEKKIRYAARNMFHTINAAQKEVLSPDEYSEAIKKLTGGKEQKLLLAAGKRIGENISEQEFVKTLSRKVQGTLNLTSSERSDAYDAAGPLEKVVKFPRETATVLMDQGLEFASRDGLSLVMSCVPTDQIYFLMLFFVYGFLSTKFLLLILPLVVFYISFGVIVMTTLQMFYKKRKLKEASALAEMLKVYDVGVSVDDTQSQYTWNSLTPYLIFFATIPLVVVSFALADKSYIPCSEMCVLNGIFCGICFLAISDSHDLITLLALFCNFLGALPVFLHNFPQIPVISSLIHLVSGSLYTIDLFNGLQVNIGIPSVGYCIIPLFFVQMAFRESFQGMYKVLVPHLVCYFWFNLITAMYPFTTWIGLTRATVGYVMLPLLVPLSMFFLLIGLVYMVVRLASSDMFGKIIITLMLAGIPLLLTQTKKLFGGKLDNKFGKIKKYVMIAFAVLAIIPLIFVRLPTTTEKTVVTLTIDDYTSICYPGDNPSTAGYQIKCKRLVGSKVVWNGVFKSVKVSGITNEVAQMMDIFPSFVGTPLRCVYGKPYGDCNDEALSPSDREFCQLMTSLGHECHLAEHDKFTFNFQVQIPNTDPAITLSVDAGSGQRATLLALQDGDEVQVKATLVDGLGTLSPKLKLKGIACTSRDLMVMQQVEEADDDFYYSLFDQALKVAINFFWYPLMEYVPQAVGEQPITE